LAKKTGAWSAHVNRFLAVVGEATRIDHRTLAEQGSARHPNSTVTRRVLAIVQRRIDIVHGECWRTARHADGLLQEEPLADTAAFLATAARMTPVQSRTHCSPSPAGRSRLS
jgi:hypothetical protein